MDAIKDFNYSYWEIKQYFQRFDLVIVGAGLIELSTAISYRMRHPRATVLVLERGILPDGASTRNAGFACFGSAGELLDDLQRMPEQAVWDTVKMRWDGLRLLRERLGDKAIGYKSWGGFELFDHKHDYEQIVEQLPQLNRRMNELLGIRECFTGSATKARTFKAISGVLKNSFEGQLDTAFLMNSLRELAQKKRTQILANIQVTAIDDLHHEVQLSTSAGIFKAGKVVVATNGFATQLLKINDLKPARAQVLITKPVPGLKLKGAYHYEQGYYYFRNIDNRVLFGGGRHLDVEGETTTDAGITPLIQQHLEELLKNKILPDTHFEIDRRWSGIMGVGSEKKPIIETVSPNVLAAVRMGGMGIAIGSLVGELAAEKIS